MRALRVAVSSTELGTSLVRRELGHTTISVHLDEVQSTVETASKFGEIDIESELLVKEAEHLVLGFALHEVNTAPDVSTVFALGHELECETVRRSGDSVGTGIIGTLQSAVASACSSVGAERGIPFVSVEAVGVVGFVVQPTPVSVQDDLTT
jgi:hypothetical protein